MKSNNPSTYTFIIKVDTQIIIKVDTQIWKTVK